MTTAVWGVPRRRRADTDPARRPTERDPAEDVARLVARRAVRATPGVPDGALEDFVGDPSSPLAAGFRPDLLLALDPEEAR